MYLKKIEKIKDIIAILAIILTGILFLAYFKIKHSMTFINLDELLWMYRSRFFIDGILNFNFSNLIQSSQPGIMAMWATGPFMKIVNYDFHSIYQFIENLNNSGIPYNIINDSNPQLFSNYKEISFLFNVPIFGIIAAFFFFLYYFLKKLGLARPAIFFSLLLIATTPYYIYFTTPTDKLVGIFSTLGFLSLLIYTNKNGGKNFLFLSAILCSWAVLTKLSALFLIPFGLFVLTFYNKFLLNRLLYNFTKLRNLFAKISHLNSTASLHSKIISGHNQKMRNQQIVIIKDYLSWLFVFLATSVIFLPTIITNPDSMLGFFIKESSDKSTLQASDIFLVFKVVATYLFDSFLISFNLFVIVIFIAFLFFLAGNAKKNIPVNKTATILFLYFFFFFTFIVLFSKTYSFRYLVPVLIVFQITAGMGMCEFANIISKRTKYLRKNEIYFWITVFILVSQGLLIYYSKVQKIENFPVF